MSCNVFFEGRLERAAWRVKEAMTERWRGRGSLICLVYLPCLVPLILESQERTDRGRGGRWIEFFYCLRAFLLDHVFF